MEKFVIEGGYPLSGTVDPAGNKNAALPVLAATLLTEEEVVLRNVPRIRDVDAMAELLSRLGRVGRVARGQRGRPPGRPGRPTPRPTPSSPSASAPRSCSPGPLLARFGHCEMPPPGGDVIGRRRLDPHLDAFRALGADVSSNGRFRLEAPSGRPARV